jgi:hypothetical protein
MRFSSKKIKFLQAITIDGRWDALYGNHNIGQIAQGGCLVFFIWIKGGGKTITLPFVAVHE